MGKPRSREQSRSSLSPPCRLSRALGAWCSGGGRAVAQLSSRLVPFLALRELQGKFGVPHEGRKAEKTPGWIAEWVGEEALRIEQTRDPDEIVRRTVKAIEAEQNHDGGYRYWPSASCSSEWASSYAVLALGRGAELGYPVDAAALRRGQAYLADTVAAGVCNRCSWGCYPPDETTRVFA